MSTFKLFSGSANPAFAKKVADYLGMKVSDATLTKFSDGEMSVQITQSVRGQDVFIIQPTCSPANDNLMELLIMIDALKRSSAKSINAVIPYYGYARQDRKAAPRVPISAKLVADLLEAAGIHRIVTIDLHAAQIQGFFNIPADNLFGSILFVNYIKSKNLKNPIIASPDIGGVARARMYADKLGYDLVIVDKKREKANESQVMNIIGDVEGKDVILVDDMVDTAGTLVKAAEVLKQKGATSVMACCTHGVLSGPAYERIANGVLDELVISDTIPTKDNAKNITVLTASSIIGEAIRRIYNNESVNSIFNV
ncbi:Ribose-phosphate pyrophosphokinase [Aliarcobacter thereius]|uniref:Ribose-phosphate pyrophosphokinase n=2 Tax=Aliarcobacter thereius TaxID=544718 RepID=A0A1C0B8X6_9BACT|nr:ribose-phosphate pyrophosphokinase [Aliarcobacter thereius]OCL88827.1 Ribose-phosphate pyrophosphokinase [Aliarcobacter thereius]OCL92322.1 Ribose-phosphate pyrophosphokinase [Aliarcobacter thereius]OCL94583.1 Ribose-phosphate pyrophosphokinase [Aliarcobacter thereius LMG 24486]OCM00022.1 Ribose-phosphate pyrophosphokinase [Aliarcobacter thereius]QBF15539.1 ribose-phosphate diphosphokinase [Aliarcobacter thereius LMG 24486]